ncbi:unnamed protein product [Musa acuminata subsp. malaccensis]|uniref:(wild Malaysian banana) hypothetical protein n=1 Tax=Musa acuminata subsp. malaccensis TaxID=214687 RepID=A0A8D7FR51_MUSAM|nr:unnamed protein product [Musa acuminata subsp. malaccensis]
MGCLLSTPGEASPLRRAASIGEVAVFVPGFRIPESVDLSQPLGDCLSRGLLDRLSSLRTRMVTMAAQEARRFTKPRRITTTRHGSALSELLRALEDYLPVLLGLVKDGCQLRDKVPFVWINQEDDAEETAMTNAWYEVLSVLHLMAMLSLLQANRLLLPKISSEGYQLKISEENRRKSIDILLKAAGYLDCAIRHVLPQITPEHRKDLPLDLEEGVLRALCLQALGQVLLVHCCHLAAIKAANGLFIMLPMSAFNNHMNPKKLKNALIIKHSKRLACEMVNYWHQAQNNIAKLPSTDGWAKKHQLFIKWKYAEAKAAAYYYHGLILDEGNTEKSHGVAIAALQASEEYLKESKKACETFNSTPPTSRNPPLWGSMKYLSEKIPKDASSKIRINQDLYSEERTFKTAPTLPDFALALKPDDYQLPPLDPLWNKEDHHC